MPSFDDLLSAAKQHLITPGYNREISLLLVRVLEDIVASLDNDTSLKKEIESVKESRRVLTKHRPSAPRSPKSKKLVSVQRLLSDVNEFLSEYLFEDKRLTRRLAKNAYKNFYRLLVDVRSSGLQVNLGEIEFDAAWEKDVLVRFASDELCSVIVWIEEEQIDDRTLSFFEAPQVFIVPCLMKQLPDRLSLLQKAVPKGAIPVGYRGYYLQAHNPFQGRLRFVMNPRDPKAVLKVLGRAGLISYPVMLVTSAMKSSGVSVASELQTLRTLKPDLLVSNEEIDSRNFCSMASVLWLNPNVDPEIPGTPSQDLVEGNRTRILEGICQHGTVIYEFTSTASATSFLQSVSHWLSKIPMFRMLISHHNYKSITGKEEAPDFSSNSITSFLLALRTKLSCPSVPVILFSSDLCTIHDSLYSLPLCKPTGAIEEAIDVGAMWPLTWSPDWSLFDPLLPDQTWSGELNIFDIICFNIYPMDTNGTSDPYVVVTLNGVKKTRLKSRRINKTLNPAWNSLNWTLSVTSLDSIHISVWDYDSFKKDDFEGEVIIPLRDTFKAPMPLCEQTYVLQPRRSSQKVSGTVTIRLGLSVSSRNGVTNMDKTEVKPLKSSNDIIEADRNHSIRIGRHFGRSLGESLRTAEEFGIQHVVHTCLLYINDHGLDSLGVFRVVGNRKKVSTFKDAVDAGRDIQLDDPFVAASLLKAYLRELPDPLICRTMYKKFLDLQHISISTQLVIGLKAVVDQLPRMHRDMLADILELLSRIAAHEKVNMMNSTNLATVIAPSLCIPKEISLGDVNELLLDTNAVIDLLALMIDNHTTLFPEDGSPYVNPEDAAATLAALNAFKPQPSFQGHLSLNLTDRSPPSSNDEA